MATITIPTVLRPHVEGQREVHLSGATVDEVLGELTARYPALRPLLYGPNGTLRSFVNIFLNEDNVRFLQKGATPVAEGDTLAIIPAVAGG